MRTRPPGEFAVKGTRSLKKATLNSSNGGTRHFARWASSKSIGVQGAAQDQARNVRNSWDYIVSKNLIIGVGAELTLTVLLTAE
jgi:hypothetical protein